MLRWRDIEDEDLIRFRCAECGKMLGAKPSMAVVVCSLCHLDNDVPNAQEATESHSQPVRLVSVDVPLRTLVRLGLKVSVAAIPLIVLLTLAACLVVRCVPTGYTRIPDPLPSIPPTVAQPDAGEQPTDAPPRPGVLLGLGGLMLVLLGSVGTAGAVLAWRDGSEPRHVPVLVFLLLGLAPVMLGSAMCWQYFF